MPSGSTPEPESPSTDEADVVRRPPFGDNPEVGQRGAITQRSILTAAMAVFGRHGFHDAKVELIADAAGCSRPAFYQYFASKEDVFWRLAGHLSRELEVVVDQLPDPDPDVRGVEALDRWINAVVEVHQAYQPVLLSFPAAFRENRPDQPLPRPLTIRLQALLADTATRHGGLPAGLDLQAAAEATVAVILRSIHYWLLGLFSIPRPRFTRALAATIHRVIYGPLAGVNTGPMVDPPPRRVPTWPAETTASVPDRPMRPRGIATRQRLLDAAGQVLPRRGYHETRVDDIVEEAGCSHGTFYQYFDSTDDLFRTLALDAGRDMAALVDTFPTASDGALDEWLTAWFGIYRSNGGVISAWQEIDQGDPDVSAMSIEIMLVFFDRLGRLVHSRGFGDTAVDALALLAVIERVPYTVVVLNQLDEAPAIAAAQHLIERGILGSTTA